MPSKIYQTLFSRQRSLTYLELNASEITIDELVGKEGFPLLPPMTNIEGLRVMPGLTEPVPQIAHQIIQKSHNLRHLRLELQNMASNDSTSDEIEGHYTSSGAMRTLFKGIQPATVSLCYLALTCVNLQRCRESLVSALDLPMLEELRIIKCYHAEEFLTILVEERKKSLKNLRTFAIYHGQVHPSEELDDTTPREARPLIKAIDEFLASSPSLYNIWICLRGFDQLPNVKNITRHGSTLRWLFVDVRKAKGLPGTIYALPEWRELCGSLRTVYQLDMAYPTVKTDFNISKHPEFCDYVGATTTIPSLHTMGFNNWPEPLDGDPEWDYLLTFNVALYEQTLAALALDIVMFRIKISNEVGCSDIRVINFGLREAITGEHIWGYNLSPMAFVKSRVHILGGEQRLRMERV
ncbi:MAG: hypothetical protein Q9192_008076, partial [Flavoplaca navasiana]